MSGFFDPSDGGEPVLELRSLDGRDFAVLRQVGYLARGFDSPFVVPADPVTFRTDLASVPGLLTWLVPRSGDFLPAAVLHDALLVPGGHLGPAVDRRTADRVFREAMGDLGTGRVRAALMWSAVTTTTLWKSPRWSERAALVSLLAAVVVIGVLATLDLFDVAVLVPWMGERPLLAELALGALFAVLVPAVLALTWGRLFPAGVVVGIALAFLLHVSAVLLVLYTAYLLLERVVSGPGSRAGRAR